MVELQKQFEVGMEASKWKESQGQIMQSLKSFYIQREMFKTKGTKKHFIVLKRGVAYLGLCFGKITVALVYLGNKDWKQRLIKHHTPKHTLLKYTRNIL